MIDLTRHNTSRLAPSLVPKDLLGVLRTGILVVYRWRVAILQLNRCRASSLALLHVSSQRGKLATNAAMN